MEEWREIDGYPNYKISTSGNVSGPRKERLSLIKNKDGYVSVMLCAPGKRTIKRVNRLVAETFLPNPDNLPVVMHLDNNRTNNDVKNLSWGTYSENNKYMYECDRHGINLTNEMREKACNARRTPVKAINLNTGEEIDFISQHDAARALGVSQQHIWGVLNGYRRSTGGYIFEYVDE